LLGFHGIIIHYNFLLSFCHYYTTIPASIYLQWDFKEEKNKEDGKLPFIFPKWKTDNGTRKQTKTFENGS
jgi:hypothetical protein